MAVIGNVAGIVYGDIDNDQYPNVGMLIGCFEEEEKEACYFFCSGALVKGKHDKDVFLTAAHCVEPFLGEATFKVTFDGAVFEDQETYEIDISMLGTAYTGTAYYNELFPAKESPTYDQAVVVLDETTGLDYFKIAPQGYLDILSDSGELKKKEFVTVGYGTIRTDQKKRQERNFVLGPSLSSNCTSRRGISQSRLLSS